jgi:hypothetical protein
VAICGKRHIAFERREPQRSAGGSKFAEAHVAELGFAKAEINVFPFFLTGIFRTVL